MDVVREQLGLLKWSQDLLKDHMIADTELLKNCFASIRLLLTNKELEHIQKKEEVGKFVNDTLADILNKLDEAMAN